MKQRAEQGDVYRAIADPTRRAILNLLLESDRSVTELVEPFAMSQPAISQHLKILRDAGLVIVERDGRQRRYRLDPAPLAEVYDWIAHYERFWNSRLDALGDFLDMKSRKKR